jgi:hypothetical protein
MLQNVTRSIRALPAQNHDRKGRASAGPERTNSVFEPDLLGLIQIIGMGLWHKNARKSQSAWNPELRHRFL